MRKAYDLIVSLGGNCSAAHNLLYRNMRHFALPFDWCFFRDTQPLSYLIEGFSNNFKNFCLKENLVELKPDERADDHDGKMQYKDTYTGYYFVNHFYRPIQEPGAYEEVAEKLHRRTERLITKIKESKYVLFILTFDFQFDLKNIKELKYKLSKLFPKTKFFFEILHFNASKDTKKVYGGYSVRYIKRNYTKQDFQLTTPEWKFLDKLSYPENRKKGLYKIYYKIWKHLGKKLRKKGIIQ